MGHPPFKSLAPGLLALIVLGGTGGSEGLSVTAKWSLQGSDFAIWDVFELAGEGDTKGSPLPREHALGLFGYQIDKRHGARFPLHRTEEIPYDLALRVPLGRVHEGQKVKLQTRYDGFPRTLPMDLVLVGRVTEVRGSTFRLEGEVSGSPATRFDPKLQEGRPWLLSITGTIETEYDCERGMMTSSVVHLESVARSKDEGTKGGAPAPKTQTYRLRFQLRETRERVGSTKEHTWKFRATVGQAIVRGTSWLRGKTGKDGTYGDVFFYHKFSYGETCFAALTLLRCGEKRDDPFILALMDKIRRFPLEYTYELSVALMAMEAFYAPPDEVDAMQSGKRPVPQRREVPPADLEWMLRHTLKLLSLANSGPDGLTWGYKREIPRPDLSNIQYAALGLLSAWRCGVEIPEEAWVGMAKGVLSHQPGLEGETPRGYPYEPGKGRAQASMTVGAIGTLQIAGHILALEKSRQRRGRLGKMLDGAIQEGWAWLGKHWTIQRHPPQLGRRWLLYYLYGLERAGVLCRVRKIKGHDWYYEGAQWLLATQEEDGHWDDEISGVHNTCFALLFLKRATIPIPEPTQVGK